MQITWRGFLRKSCARADSAPINGPLVERHPVHRYPTPSPKQKPNFMAGLLLEGCLTMTYFRTGNLHYHRRAAVSRSCSRWEGVVPTGCGRQALSIGDRTDIARDVASVHRKGRSKARVRLRKH